MKKLATLTAVLALSACASQPASSPATPPPPVIGGPSVWLPPPPPPDACKAAEHQWLVGRSRTEIPVPSDPSRRRVACTSCPVTMDYRADRLNIFFDAETGVIKEVKCG